HGRLLFISYLKPLVNGHGFYHIESQFTDLRRMDVVVDYGRDQFIIELKIWRGSAAQEDAYEQLLGYMASKNMDRGYLLTFDFRKDAHKEQKAEWVQVGGKEIFEVVV
ncbi:MAG: AAA family ATPase, partial [Clostridiales bacterium]|nr:AAA family ATPase [Clostridiales bacterium]